MSSYYQGLDLSPVMPSILHYNSTNSQLFSYG